ncbi:CvpA family protein, partial [candidate division KSB1 bacterium]
MVKTIDTIILGLLLFLVIKGVWRGFKKELISLITYGSAFLITTSQLDTGTRFFQARLNLHPLFAYFVAYVTIFLVSFLVIKFFAKNIRKLISKDPESGLIDSLGGAMLGFCLGMVIVSLFLSML